MCEAELAHKGGHSHEEQIHDHTCESGSCGCAHEHGSGEEDKKQLVWLLGAAVLFAAAFFIPSGIYKTILFLLAYLAAGWEVLFKALKNIFRGEVFDEAFLMSVASIGALLLGEYPEGVAVMLFYQVGEFFQSLAVGHSRKSISQLMDIRPDSASRIEDGEIVTRDAKEILPGDLILVKPGERIPLDGVVVEGASQIDTSALTGESMPREVAVDSSVLSGCVNQSGTLKVKVTKPFGESTASKILELVENAGANKAKAELFITRFARWYTPAVVLIAAAVAILPPLVLGGGWSEYIRRALVFLVISCPCALVISVPMGFFAGLGCASKNGILIKGSNYLEALRNPEIFVFDKTGTLTEGKFQVTQVIPGSLDRDTLLEYAAHAEVYSTHPIAQSLRAALGAPLSPCRVGGVREQAGGGVEAQVDGKTVLAGNRRLMEGAGIAVPTEEPEYTTVYVAVDGLYGGAVLIGDMPKPEAKEALGELRKLGVRRTVMLTGDKRAAGERAGREVGVDEVHAELLPQDKVKNMEVLMKNKTGVLVFVGDGMNDAPVLARADIGIAMGALGTDAAIEAADVVIMDDNLKRLPTAVGIARRTHTIVLQNIVFALSVKALILTLGALGYASMWAAVFADVGVSLLAVLNSMRALSIK